MRTTRFALFLTAASLLACQPAPATTGSDSGPPADTGPQACTVPTGDMTHPIGTEVGRTMRDFTLPRCDDTPFHFYGEAEGFCAARLTVLTIAAGWCGPCRLEATQIQAALADAYAAQGVRVVQVLIQDDNHLPPDAAFCQGWVNQYGLTFPELYDPTQITQIYFPMGALPATLIVDSQGVIVHREYGTTANLTSIRTALDTILAGM